MRWRSGRMIGLPDMRPDSFKKAMTEPVKVMAPMATPSDISMRLAKWMAPRSPMPKLSGACSAAAATNTAARPTSEWNAATSSGIAVIGDAPRRDGADEHPFHRGRLHLFRRVQHEHMAKALALEAAQRAPELLSLLADHVRAKVAVGAAVIALRGTNARANLK